MSETKNRRPSILHCPVSIEFEPCDASELDPLVTHLDEGRVVEGELVFPRGTHLEDGRLDLCKQCIGPVGVAKVSHAVASNSQTQHWLLGANGLGDQGARSVAEAVRKNPNLETIYLGCNLIGEEGARQLADSLKENDHVTGLWLKRNPIGVNGARAIVEMLQSNRRLRTLDLVHTKIGSEGIRLIAQQLTKEETSVKRLYLGGNEMGPVEAEWIAEMLRVNQSIHSLYLNVNRFGDAGLRILSKAIATNDQLISFSVASNSIGADGVWGLVQDIQENSSLQDLDLGYDNSTNVLGEQPNHFADEGALAISELISSGSSLRRLSLLKSGVTSAGGEHLLTALNDNCALMDLEIGQGIAHSLKQRIHQRLSENSKRQVPFTLPDHHDIAAIKSVYRS